MKIDFTGEPILCGDKVYFKAKILSVDGKNEKVISCQIAGNVLEDIDPKNRLDNKIEIFNRHRNTFESIARKLIQEQKDKNIIIIGQEQMKWFYS